MTKSEKYKWQNQRNTNGRIRKIQITESENTNG